MTDTSSWSWDERMGRSGVDKLSPEDKLTLKELQEEMEIYRLDYLAAKTMYDRACDAVYVFVRSKRESR